MKIERIGTLLSSLSLESFQAQNILVRDRFFVEAGGDIRNLFKEENNDLRKTVFRNFF